MNKPEKYYTTIIQRLSDYKKINNQNTSSLNKKGNLIFTIYLILCSVVDVLLLLIKLKLNKDLTIVYTAPGYCNLKNGKFSDRILSDLNLKNRIYINQSKESVLRSIDNYKVYNIGGMVKLLSLFKNDKKSSLKNLKAYSFINNLILKNYRGTDVYLICYYDANGISVVFSKYRNKFNLIEIQHGNIINYPPYSYPSTIKIADIFYVKNQSTVNYLRKYLNKNFEDIEYRLLLYPKSQAVYQEGKHVLYASTIELNGIHPNFISYINQIKPEDNVNIYIRLHPREKDKKEVFKKQLIDAKATIIFDESKNWLESNQIKNLIVVSPWSSVIEDAADNGYKVIILEELGKNRFSYLMDDKNVIFADNLEKILQSI
jgi:hypothetical protein